MKILLTLIFFVIYFPSFAETYACGDFVIKRKGNQFIQYSKVTNNSNVYSIISEDDLYMHMIKKSFYRVTIVSIDKKRNYIHLLLVNLTQNQAEHC